MLAMDGIDVHISGGVVKGRDLIIGYYRLMTVLMFIYLITSSPSYTRQPSLFPYPILFSFQFYIRIRLIL